MDINVTDYNRILNDSYLNYIHTLTYAIVENNKTISEQMDFVEHSIVDGNDVLKGLTDAMSTVVSYQNMVKKYLKLVARD